MTTPGKKCLSCIVLFTMLLSSCGYKNTAKVMERQQQFVLDAPRPAGPPKYTPAKGVLKVRRFTAASQYDTYEMVYRRSELVYDSDFYNRFFASPTSLVAEKVRQWLSDSGVFAHVLDPFSGADFAYILEGNVLGLYGDYRQKGSPQAVMAIQFTLIDEHRRRDSVLFQKDYHAVAPMEKEAASQLVLGFNACLADILLQLESDLAGIATDGQ